MCINVIPPTVHLNGTSADELQSQHLAVMDACLALHAALAAATPNGRDYYPQGPTFINLALAAHQSCLLNVKLVREHAERMVEAIQAQLAPA